MVRRPVNVDKEKVMRVELSVGATMVLFAATFFGAGWGWGQWWAERVVRQQKVELESGRIAVSMPANLDDASKTMTMLATLLRAAEEERKAGAAK